MLGDRVGVVRAIAPLHDLVTWYKITHAMHLPLSPCATCSPTCVILYHVTGSCKGPIFKFSLYFIGMSHSPALPWYAYTPGRLPYETDRAAHRKF